MESSEKLSKEKADTVMHATSKDFLLHVFEEHAVKGAESETFLCKLNENSFGENAVPCTSER